MNRVEHLLTILSEECAEVSQRATKALRFSLSEVQPGQDFTNAQRIMHEWADLAGTLDLLIAEGHLKFPADFIERCEQKKSNIEKFLRRSAEHGAFHPGDERDRPGTAAQVVAQADRVTYYRTALREVAVNLAQIEVVLRHRDPANADEVRSYRLEILKVLEGSS
jgi:hypothetical protein